MSEEIKKEEEEIIEDHPPGYSFWNDIIGEFRTFPVIRTTRVRLGELRAKEHEPSREEEQIIDTAPITSLVAKIRTDPKYEKMRNFIGTMKKKEDLSPLSLLDKIEENPNDAANTLALACCLEGKSCLADVKALLTIPQESTDVSAFPRLRFPGHSKIISLLARIAEREENWETIIHLLNHETNSRKNKNPNDMRILVYAFNRLGRSEEAIWAVDFSTEKTSILQNPTLVENYIVGMKGAGANFEKRFMEIIKELFRNNEKEKGILKVMASIFQALNEQSYPGIVVSIAEKFGDEYTFHADHDITIQRALAHNGLGEYERTVDLLTLPEGKGLRFDSQNAEKIFDYAVRRLRDPTQQPS